MPRKGHVLIVIAQKSKQSRHEVVTEAGHAMTMTFNHLCSTCSFLLTFSDLFPLNMIHCIEGLEMRGCLQVSVQFVFWSFPRGTMIVKYTHTRPQHTNVQTVGTEQYRGDFLSFFFSAPGSMRRFPASVHKDDIQ